MARTRQNGASGSCDGVFLACHTAAEGSNGVRRMNEEWIWSLEERFWIAGESHYRSALDPECIMGFPAACRHHEGQRNPPKSCPSAPLVLGRNQRTPRCTSHVRLDSAGLSSARQSHRCRAIRSALHLVISRDGRWLETLPASSDPDPLRQRSRASLKHLAAGSSPAATVHMIKLKERISLAFGCTRRGEVRATAWPNYAS